MEMKEFQFPDEKEKNQEAESEFEFEVEDDTPEPDRDREPMPENIVEELDKDELDQYSDDVKQKFKQLKKVWHDERREKEKAHREQQQALEATKKLLDENRRMRETINNGQTQYVDAVKTSTQMQLDEAKRSYKDAYESGDTDKMLDAQEALAKITLQMDRVNNYQPVPLQEPQYNVQNAQQTPQVDQRALAWQERNPWFGQDEEMTAAALGLHEKLKRGGVSIGSDEYYATLDKTMRRRFAENFGESEEPRQRAQTVVASAKRSTAPKRIRLKQSQLNTIKKLGITPEQYVKEVLKLES
jgi:hypothetical protein